MRLKCLLVTACQRSCGRQCFHSCLSVHRKSPHVTITHDALYLAVQPPPLPDIRPGPPLLVISFGHHWRPVQTCSFGNTPPPQRYLVLITEARTVSKLTCLNRYPLTFKKCRRNHECFCLLVMHLYSIKCKDTVGVSR